jgi:hypothetical protein
MKRNMRKIEARRGNNDIAQIERAGKIDPAWIPPLPNQASPGCAF